jgi:hypothetical protein
MERPLYVHREAPVAFDDAVELLAGDAASILQGATERSVRRADELVTTARATVAGVEVERDVIIDVEPFQPVEMLRGRLPLHWRAREGTPLFPVLDAHLEVAALAMHPPRIQVTLVGSYRPPLGWLGGLGDAAVGHRIAEETATHFLDDVVAHLAELAPTRTSHPLG